MERGGGVNRKIPEARKYIYEDLFNTENFEETASEYYHLPNRKEKIINKYPNLHKRYAWVKSVMAPLRLRFIYKKMMKSS